MPPAHLPLANPKFELMERPFLDHGHGHLSDHGCDLDLDPGCDFDWGYDLDFDLYPDHSASKERRHEHYFLHNRENELVAAEFYVPHIAVSLLSAGLRKVLWHFGLHEGQVPYMKSATHDISGAWGFLRDMQIEKFIALMP